MRNETARKFDAIFFGDRIKMVELANMAIQKSELKTTISLSLAMVMFIFCFIIFYNSPFFKIAESVAREADKTWWSDTLIAGSLGWFGIGVLFLPVGALIFAPSYLVFKVSNYVFGLYYNINNGKKRV